MGDDDQVNKEAKRYPELYIGEPQRERLNFQVKVADCLEVAADYPE